MLAFDKPCFKACYVHGFVQDSKGRKMSKSVGNYILPSEVVDKYGADSFRYYAIAGTKAGLDLNYNFDDLKVRHKNLTVLWNVHNYLLDMCKNNNVKANSITKVQDFSREERYIFSKLNSTIKKVTEKYDGYYLDEVPDLIEELYLELSRTYIQLIRDKVTLGSKEDKELVIFTLFRVLMETIKMLATVSPFIAEEIFLNMKKEFDLPEESIHLFDFPSVSESLIDLELEEEVSIAQNVNQSILSAREKMQRGVRWPVIDVIIVSKDSKVKDNIRKSEDIIKKQTNIKKITYTDKLDSIKNKIRSDFKSLGPDFGETAVKIIAQLHQESADTVIEHLDKDNVHKMKIDGKEIELKKHHLIVERVAPENLFEGSFKGGFVYLNNQMDDDIYAEGYSRELMRRVQVLRKKAGLSKMDNVILVVKANEDLVEYFNKWEGLIKEKCGAEKLKISTDNPARKLEHSSAEKVKGKEFEIFLEKI